MESVFRIRDPGPFLPLDPRSGMGKKSKSGPVILQFFDADQDPGSGNLFGPESGMEKIRIRNKHPGSATLDKFLIFLFLWTIFCLLFPDALLIHKTKKNTRS
jgi:hypothetical protein